MCKLRLKQHAFGMDICGQLRRHALVCSFSPPRFACFVFSLSITHGICKGVQHIIPTVSLYKIQGVWCDAARPTGRDLYAAILWLQLGTSGLRQGEGQTPNTNKATQRHQNEQGTTPFLASPRDFEGFAEVATSRPFARDDSRSHSRRRPCS